MAQAMTSDRNKPGVAFWATVVVVVVLVAYPLSFGRRVDCTVASLPSFSSVHDLSAPCVLEQKATK